jgi:hypothetical protein
MTIFRVQTSIACLSFCAAFALASSADAGEAAPPPDKKPDAPILSGTEAPAPNALDFLKTVDISGFLSTSFFANLNGPASGKNVGLATDPDNGAFALNKLKLSVEKPVAASRDKWDVGFRADLIFGQDAPVFQSAGLSLGAQGDIEQAFIKMNVPVGNGLLVTAGKQVTLMGVEVVEETGNPNWSLGNQYLFTENVAALGVGLDYYWTDSLETQLRVINGWDVARDNNHALSFMGQVTWKPDADTSLALLGYGGPEQAGNSSNWRRGAELLASRKLLADLTAQLQLDYGREDGASLSTPGGAADWRAAGLWMSWDPSPGWGLALRADYFDDADGARTSGAPVSAPFPANQGQELFSLTLTLNLKPVKNLMLRPELRWDHSSLDAAFNGRADQLTIGAGALYTF